MCVLTHKNKGDSKNTKGGGNAFQANLSTFVTLNVETTLFFHTAILPENEFLSKTFKKGHFHPLSY